MQAQTPHMAISSECRNRWLRLPATKFGLYRFRENGPHDAGRFVLRTRRFRRNPPRDLPVSFTALDRKTDTKIAPVWSNPEVGATTT